MPTYRGHFTPVAREAAEGCPSERYFDPTGHRRYCGSRSPFVGWHNCTRLAGHRGDHVVHSYLPSLANPYGVIERWGPNGELTDSEEE